MAEWTIYGKNGVAKATVKELELHDEWMAECFLTLTVKSAEPVSFAVGDYLDYRDERYTINYDPSVVKKARRDTYGEGFVYDNIKFVSVQDEIVRCDFNDLVLSDNKMHYTSLPTFPFYCETVDDLLDRIQANLEELYPGEWIVISPMLDRDRQRGLCVGREAAFINAYNEYIGGGSFSYDKTGVSITVDNINCWEAMKYVNDSFGLNFIVRGRVVIVGTVGLLTSKTFRYGKGNGLYELERISDSEQRIITRLRGYGAETNLPTRFYATLNQLPFAVVDSVRDRDIEGDKPFIDFNIDLTGSAYWTYQAYLKLGEWTNEQQAKSLGYLVTMRCGGYDVIGRVFTGYGLVRIYMEYSDTDDRTDAGVPVSVSDKATAIGFINAIHSGVHVYFLDRIKLGAFDKEHLEGGSVLPDNMAVNRLMLPGFPTKSLAQWVEEHDEDERIQAMIEEGFTFSTDPLRPYIDSPNKEYIGLRPGSLYFDGSNENEDIHPTIEGMEWGGKRCDVILDAEKIQDNGVLADDAKEEDRQVKVILPYGGFELDELKTDETTIEIKDGMCGARSLKVKSVSKTDEGNWECVCERDYDDTLHLYFPYSDFQIHAGDHYVLTGVELPKSYVDAASEKLFYACVEALKQNHSPRFTFQPRIDELWMARQHDEATAAHQRSLHDTLKAGDIFVFTDEDLGIEGRIIIDILTIKENGNNGIPTYEVTLRDEKVTSTIEKRLDKVTSAVNAGLGGGGGYSGRQTGSLIESLGSQLFLSKIYDDEAQGVIGFLKGAYFGAKKWMIDALGNATLNNITFSGILRGTQAIINKIKSSNYTGEGMLDTGWQIINDYNGTNSQAIFDYLYIRKKAIFEELELRKLSHIGGNFCLSPASGRVWRVELYDAVDGGNLLNYSEFTVPYTLGGTMLSLFKKLFKRTPDPQKDKGLYLLGRHKLIAKKITQEDIAKAKRIRVYLFTDDGTTKTMENWTVGAQARCQTFNIDEQMNHISGGETTNPQAGIEYWQGEKVQNTYWWRVVSNVGKGTCDDGKEHSFIEFLINTGNDSNVADAGSDVPAVGDEFAQFGHRDQERNLGNIIMIETANGDSPAIKFYKNVHDFNLNGRRKTVLSPKNTEIYSQRYHIETEYEDVIIPMDRGAWVSGTKYYYYDRVSHAGSYWLCIINDDGSYTTQEPGTGGDWLKQVSKGDKGEASFKSSVFKRTNQNIAGTVPTGGDYNNPYPGGADGTDGWYDGIPQGTETIWMSTRVFSTDGQAPQQEAWTPAQLMSDTESFDVEFSPETSPASPTDNNRHKTDYPYGYQGQVWFDPTLDRYSAQGVERDFTKMLWMSERTKANGVWGEWKITKIKGEQGSFKSRVFCRSNTTPDTPSSATPQGTTYNTFDNPVPPPVSGQPTWTDGIPSTPEGAIIWSSVNTFDSTGDHAEWSVPVQETDTASLDVEFSPDAQCPNDPAGDDPNADNTAARNAQHWYDPLKNASTSGVDWSAMIWRAERKIANGAYSGGWTKSRIKGETGVSGAFKSRVFCRTNEDIKTATVTGGTYNNPWPGGTNPCTQTYTINGKQVTVTWHDGIPDGNAQIWSTVCTFTPSTTSPQWSAPCPESDTSTLDIEFSASETKPNPPTGNTPFSDHSSEGWYDPSHLPSGQTMIWRAERQVRNGVYYGEWVITRIYGEKGDNATTTELRYTGPLGANDTIPTTSNWNQMKSASQYLFSWTPTIPTQTQEKPNVYVGVWEYTAGSSLDVYATQPKSVTLFSHYGKNGDEGKNGTSIVPVPNSLVITQQKVDGGVMPLDSITEYIYPVARDSGTIVSLQSLVLDEKLYCEAAVESDSTYGKHIKITGIWKLQTEANGNYKVVNNKYVQYSGQDPQKTDDGKWVWKYAPSGSVKFTATAKTAKGDSFSATISVPFACNLIGTYMMMVEEDVKTEIYEDIDADNTLGILTTTNFNREVINSSKGESDIITKIMSELGSDGTVDPTTGSYTFQNSKVRTAESDITKITAELGGWDSNTHTFKDNTRVDTAEEHIQTIREDLYGIDGHTIKYSTIDQTASDIQAMVTTINGQTAIEVALSSGGSWEQGNTSNRRDTYDNIKDDGSTQYCIRTKSMIPVDNEITLRITAGYQIFVHTFDGDGICLDDNTGGYGTWWSNGIRTLTVGNELSSSTVYIAMLMRKNNGASKIDPSMVDDALTVGKLSAAGIDVGTNSVTLYGDKVSFVDSSGDSANISFDNAHNVFKIGGFYIDSNVLRTNWDVSSPGSIYISNSTGEIDITGDFFTTGYAKAQGGLEVGYWESSSGDKSYNTYAKADIQCKSGVSINTDSGTGSVTIGNSSKVLTLTGSQSGTDKGVYVDNTKLTVEGDVIVGEGQGALYLKGNDNNWKMWYDYSKNKFRMVFRQLRTAADFENLEIGEVYRDGSDLKIKYQ